MMSTVSLLPCARMTGASKGPSFKTRPGAPLEADLVAALEALSAKAAPEDGGDLTAAEDAGTGDAAEHSKGDKSGELLWIGRDIDYVIHSVARNRCSMDVRM